MASLQEELDRLRAASGSNAPTAKAAAAAMPALPGVAAPVLPAQGPPEPVTSLSGGGRGRASLAGHRASFAPPWSLQEYVEAKDDICVIGGEEGSDDHDMYTSHNSFGAADVESESSEYAFLNPVSATTSEYKVEVRAASPRPEKGGAVPFIVPFSNNAGKSQGGQNPDRLQTDGLSRRASTGTNASSRSRSSRRSMKTEDLRPWPVWQHASKIALRPNERTTTGMRLGALEQLRQRAESCDLEEHEDDAHARWKKMDFMVSHPGARHRLFLIILGIFFIIFDITVAPMSVFPEVEMTPFTDVVSWLAAFFWTVEMFLSFGVGYYHNEVLEMRYRKTAVRYMQTWFLMDLTLVVFDWIHVFNTLEHWGVDLMRSSKSMRKLRAFRGLRLVRAFQLPMALKQAIVMLGRNTTIGMFIGLVAHFVSILILSHLGACIWFVIGNGPADGWVATYMGLSSTWQEYYVSSLHWVLTQFTPATNRVQPQTLQEAGFAVGVLLFGLVAFSSFLSSVTNTIAHLRSIKQKHENKFVMLERYLHDNHISFYVSLRVRRYLDHYFETHKNNVSVKDVELLGYLSEPLQVELYYEVNSPPLRWHVFFVNYSQVNIQALQKLCHRAVKSICLSCADVLFGSGDEATSMYFLTFGGAEYQREVETEFNEDEEEQDITHVSEKSWVAEPVLWVQWEHCGTIQATTESVALALDSTAFQKVVTASKQGQAAAGRYAIQVAKALQEMSVYQMSDLPGDLNFNPAAVCDEAFKDYSHVLKSNKRWFSRASLQVQNAMMPSPTTVVPSGSGGSNASSGRVSFTS
eukprot:TRINITY_DN25128_c0_g1_i1.p1 TRINITY_DN25128_c0_g1~~TRINITY_DN25128_c0_g1_i1.p1  ORF type:complete len:858 (+),score=110.90 TRINITY_DN25128_c0_g1_i1:159-2576(+)